MKKVDQGTNVRRRQISGQQGTGKSSEKQHVAEHQSKKKIVVLLKSKLIRFYSILTACLSAVAAVLRPVKYRKSGQIWAQHSSLRFPKYGTKEFARQCNWTIQAMPQELSCTIWARPNPVGHEGISHWTSDIVTGYLLARLARCNFLMDYGPGVNINEILTPATSPSSGSASQPLNWTVPTGFDCKRQPSDKICVEYPSPSVRRTLKKSLPKVPTYRFAYRMDRWLKRSDFMRLEQVLPGFHLETGMACSLERLFQLAPTAARFEPELFSRILPILHDDEGFIMTIYIRTGLTDVLAQNEIGLHHTDPSKKFQSDSTVKCALSLEEHYVKQHAKAGPAYSRVLWMVLTDSQAIKQWITEQYSGKYVNGYVSGEKNKIPRREVLTTTSRGVHTRISRFPSTADFAEAMIDWYLIGESDLVIGSGISFGATAALRTARPYYDLYNCTLKQTVY